MVYNCCYKGGDVLRVNMTLNDDLLSRIDAYASANYMSRSSVVSFACNQFLITNEVQSLLVDLKRAVQKIADTGTIDESTQKQLDDFVVLFDLVLKSGSN